MTDVILIDGGPAGPRGPVGDVTQAATDARVAAEAAKAETEALLNGLVVIPGGALINGVAALGALGAVDANGDFFAYMAFMPDGSIEGAGIGVAVTAALSGFELRTDQVAGFDWAITQKDASGDVFLLIGKRTGGAIEGSGGFVQSSPVWHIPFHGQSNAAADESQPVISAAATGWGGLMFGLGVATYNVADNPTAPESRAGSGFGLVDLVASGVETRANAMADQFKARLVGASRYSAGDDAGGPSVLITSASLGGRKLTELGPEDHGASGEVGARTPGGMWPTLLDDVTRARAAVEAAGRDYSLPFWVYDQGESEGDGKIYVNGPVLGFAQVISDYADKALAMVQAFDGAVKARTAKTRPTPCLVTPACFNPYTPTAWLDVADQSDLAFVVGPRYQMPSAVMSTPRGDGIHYSPDGHRWIGEMCAKVGARIMRDGEDWQPLRALRAIKVDAVTVDVEMHVPAPPLVLDEQTWPQVLGWGFRVWAGTVAARASLAYPSTVQIQPDGRTVRLTFAAPIPSTAFLTIGESAAVAEFSGVPATAVTSVTYNSAPAYEVTMAGDYVNLFTRALNDDAFTLDGNGLSQGVIRAVRLSGQDTVLTGEDSELRTGAGYRAFEVGDLLSARLMFPRTNFRDSDAALSVNNFQTGGRAGRPYPLQNWLCTYTGLSVEGS